MWENPADDKSRASFEGNSGTGQVMKTLSHPDTLANGSNFPIIVMFVILTFIRNSAL